MLKRFAISLVAAWLLYLLFSPGLAGIVSLLLLGWVFFGGKTEAGSEIVFVPSAEPLTLPEIIPEEDDPEVKRLRDLIRASDFRAVHAFLEKTTQPNPRAYYVSVLSDWKSRPAWLDQWVQAFPESEIPLLVRGRHSIRWAWEARGGAAAQDVQEKMWPVFFSRLEKAEEDFVAAAEINPRDATPWAEMLISARGLQLEAPEPQERFEEVIERAPDHWEAHVNMMTALCKKWGGSREEMFEFARSRSKNAPKGSPLHALVPLAHVEDWLYPEAFENNPDEARRLMTSPETQEELAKCYAMFQDMPEEPAGGVYRKSCLNIFAYCFSRMGDRARAIDAFARLGNIYRETPWSYIGGRSAFDKYRVKFNHLNNV
jgi:hypothetical protein